MYPLSIAPVYGPLGVNLETEGCGMNRLLFVVIALIGRWCKPRYNAHLQILEAQIRMLRSRINATRIVPMRKERAELIRLGALVGDGVV